MSRPSNVGCVVAVAICLLIAFVLILISPFNPFPLYFQERLPRTNETLVALSASIDAFRLDWGQYPPSRFTDEPADLQSRGGAGLLAYYLLGPRGTGWGPGNVPSAPFGKTPQRQFGPYATLDPKRLALEESRPVGFLDAFAPPEPILYFRAEPGREPLFDVRDNPVDPTGRCGFVSQEHFEKFVQQPVGPDRKRTWVRQDYLLISPGQDRLYGPVTEDPATGQWRPARPDETDVYCDDVANFAYDSCFD